MFKNLILDIVEIYLMCNIVEIYLMRDIVLRYLLHDTFDRYLKHDIVLEIVESFFSYASSSTPHPCQRVSERVIVSRARY